MKTKAIIAATALFTAVIVGIAVPETQAAAIYRLVVPASVLLFIAFRFVTLYAVAARF